eukprot:g1162.t1
MVSPCGRAARRTWRQTRISGSWTYFMDLPIAACISWLPESLVLPSPLGVPVCIRRFRNSSVAGCARLKKGALHS